MNNELVRLLVENIHYLDPPGCVSEFVDHPFPNYRHHRCVEVGFVIEHRFAFCYWIKCKQKLQEEQQTAREVDDEHFMPPDLVTWDWHDDFGGDNDVAKDKLVMLNQRDEQEVALYAWAGLCSLNDGQIIPAVWLNAIGNVYIVQKQHQNCTNENLSIEDRFGHKHQVFYFRSLKDFPKTFEKTNTGSGVIWDVDLDYFTQGRSVPDQCYTPPLRGENIAVMLSPDTPWIPLILRDLKAITIALEPKYTGGLSVSLELYRHWESALFAAPLCSKRCRWRKGLFKA